MTYDNRTGGGYGYSYDGAGRLKSFSINGMEQAEYGYDYLGHQVYRKLMQSGQPIYSAYGLDGNRMSEVDAATGAVIREYVRLGDIPVGVIEGGQVYDVRADQVNRPVFATDSTGAQVWSAAYLPFGGVAVSSGLPIELRFPGQWYQAESGLHQNWMRDYDPTTGRYQEADPLGLAAGSASIYGYVGQNPLRWTDKRGLYASANLPLPPDATNTTSVLDGGCGKSEIKITLNSPPTCSGPNSSCAVGVGKFKSSTRGMYVDPDNPSFLLCFDCFLKSQGRKPTAEDLPP